MTILKIENFNETLFKESIDSNLIEQLEEGKFKFILDLQKFINICHEINLILSKHNYFLRIIELKGKYKQLSMKEIINKI